MNLGWGPTCDPALFSQALMYYASVEASKGWPGEPETDPTQDDVDSDIGIELTPTKCLEKANAALLADPDVIGGQHVNRHLIDFSTSSTELTLLQEVAQHA